MNNKKQNLQQKRLLINKHIQSIKKRQNELMLRNLVLSSIREDLESKRLIIDRLINDSNKPSIPKQIINMNLDNSSALPWEFYMN